MELSEVQPITKMETPQAYLDNPNGRVLYMLKTYQLKQLDVLRRQGYNNIKAGIQSGDKALIGRGVKNLAKISLTMGLGGATMSYVKDFLMGKDVDPALSDVPMNMLKTFSMSEYTLDKMKKGKYKDVVLDTVVPPLGAFEKVMHLDRDTVKQVAPMYYNFFMGGLEESKVTKKELQDKRKRESVEGFKERTAANRQKRINDRIRRGSRL